jgi:ESS family glutamate:Na+ symporter
MDSIVLDGRETVVIAIFAVYLGRFVNAQVAFLRTYQIPDSVTGGIAASILFGLIYGVTGVEFDFNTSVRDVFLLIFFACIGLSTGLATVLAGGRQIVVLGVIAVVFMFVQNGTGVLVANLSGQDSLMGVVGGTVSMAGGPGTAVAWGQVLQDSYGIDSAINIGTAFATIGMVVGGLLGGPLAARLINRHQLQSQADIDSVPAMGMGAGERRAEINYDSMLRTILVIFIAVGMGLVFDKLLKSINFQLPEFAACMITGMFLINVGPKILPMVDWPLPNRSKSLSLMSELSVSLVLVMSLMPMKWSMLIAAGPSILLIVVAQSALVVLFAMLIVFRAMGSNYDGAVIASGYVGVFLGVTSTGMANVSAVTQRHGASPKAILMIPLLGVFLVDLLNPFVVQMFLGWFGS